MHKKKNTHTESYTKKILLQFKKCTRLFTNKKFLSGFTLIELLVVISIIALLASVVLASVGSARNKAKDAKIATEIHSIQLAFEAYNLANGGYPNPGSSSSYDRYCIGNTDCELAGTSVPDQMPEIDDVAINISNLALVFPAYENISSYLDSSGNENKGYVYISCGSGTPTCPHDTATLIYPTTGVVKFLSVGSFTETSCEIESCQSDYGQNCGSGGNSDCSNFSSTFGACNYDVGGTGSSSGDCTCGAGSNCSIFCNDSGACNYDINGTGSCDYSCNNISGCTDPGSCNYNSLANADDGSCDYSCIGQYGCMDSTACNYDSTATMDNGGCDYSCFAISGCTDANACNYNSEASIDDGGCDYSCQTLGCTDSGACNYDPTANTDNGSCDYGCMNNDYYGCMDPSACNYDSMANIDNASCDYSCMNTNEGCTDWNACNYDPSATSDNGTCDYSCQNV